VFSSVVEDNLRFLDSSQLTKEYTVFCEKPKVKQENFPKTRVGSFKSDLFLDHTQLFGLKNFSEMGVLGKFSKHGTIQYGR